MPYVGGRLTPLFDPDLSQRAARRMADEMGDKAHELVAAYSPIRRTPPGGGNLKTSWYREPVWGARRTVRDGVPAYEVKVATNVDYAPYVEEGTGIWGPRGSKYPIRARPGKVLTWIAQRPFLDKRTGRVVPAGTRVYAKQVMHPGSPGQHMMGRTALTVEVALDEIVDGALREWAREQERAGG
jgi:hypothetical protein